MRKRALSLALALMMCLGLCVPASAASGDFIIENGILTKYNGPGGDITIPDGVTSIGGLAFQDCTSLTSVNISPSVIDIRYGAFDGCTSLTNVNIPSSVTIIRNSVFRGCTSLTSVNLPFGITKLDEYVFQNCTSLTSMTIPSGVTDIGIYAFESCVSLKKITIPSSVSNIGYRAFLYCINLTDIYYTGTKAQWDAIQIDEGNEPLTSATIHYAPDAQQELPSVAVEDIPASGTAYASTQTVTVDGKAVEFQMYALKDAGGNPTNYIKLRDMAYILNGTKAQFAVGYDGTISLTTGQPYQPGGTEMTTPYSGDRAYTGGAQAIKVNGRDVSMTSITLTDDNGGGYNYFKLRDLGQVLGFNVYWADGQGVSIQTDRPYTG